MRIHLALVAIFASTLSVAADPCPEYVARFKPAIFTQGSTPLDAQMDCVSISIGSRPLLAAVYSNDAAVLSIVDPMSQPPSLVHEVKAPMFGTVFDLRAMDLDGDGRKEIVIQTRSRMAEMLWAYSLTDSAVPVLITPDDESGGPINRALLVDVDGDGRISIVDTKEASTRQANGDLDVDLDYTLYSLQNGKYVKRADRDLFFVEWFERGNGTPKPEEATVVVPQSGRYRMTLLNGEPNGRNRCSSGSVKAGDLTAFGPSDLNQQTYAITRDVSLSEVTPLTVALRSDAGCKVWILVDRPTPTVTGASATRPR